MSERVVVAMSGGVDSSVAAALLVESGADVVGVTLHLWDYPDDGTVKGRCCAPEDIHDARRVCDQLGIPHFAFDRRALFEERVVGPFVDAYLEGATPSPCVNCNRGVKTSELLKLMERLGASALATGHYARLRHLSQRVELLRGQDSSKDQSYFLHMLGQGVLKHLRFPLGGMTKQEVRQRAIELNLPGATKGESQELCFVPTGRYSEFVEGRGKGRLKGGEIFNESGVVIGRHQGIHGFTVGQRRNLGVATGRRSYVVGLDASSGTIQLGDKSQLLCSGAELDQFSLVEDLTLPLRCEVVVRYRGRLHGAELTSGPGLGTAMVEFEKPVEAVVPGQVLVAFHGERVIGGGRIRRSSPVGGVEPFRLPVFAQEGG